MKSNSSECKNKDDERSASLGPSLRSHYVCSCAL